MRAFLNELNNSYYKKYTSAVKVMEVNGFKLLYSLTSKNNRATFIKNGIKQTIRCVELSEKQIKKLNILE